MVTVISTTSLFKLVMFTALTEEITAVHMNKTAVDIFYSHARPGLSQEKTK